MKKSSGTASSRTVTLVLVSSTLLYFGCSKECRDKLPDGKPNPNCAGSHRVGGAGYYGGSHFIPTSGAGAGAATGTATSSPRGGFGATGAQASGGGG